MFVLEQRGMVGKCVNDATKIIDHSKLKKVCKIHEGERTCRYIAIGNAGFVCVKNTLLRPSLDEIVADNKMSAKADNCEGL
jgi:hypothetical protein